MLIDATTPRGRKALAALFETRSSPDFAALIDALPIVDAVLCGGRAALRRKVAELDGEAPRSLVVKPTKGVPADPKFVAAFRLAASRIAAYHERQKPKGFRFRDAAGVSFVEVPTPHAAVGVYVPGGRAFYPSSLMMGVVPAKVAGVPRIVVATPPRAYRESAELRWAIGELGVTEVLLAGGAHGIAGLVSVMGCTKIVGPGNRWVAAAKHLVSGLVSVDLPAGPSEVLILASDDAAPALLAADLLAQAEHDPEAVCLLFTTSRRLADETLKLCGEERASRDVSAHHARSPRGSGLAVREVSDGRKVSNVRQVQAFLFDSLGAAAAAAERVAIEHLQLIGRQAEALAPRLLATAGAVFVGANTPTAFGDYLAGPNHVLPTGGAARSFSGLATRDFYRYGRSVAFSAKAARALAGPAAELARFEGLVAHETSLRLRS